MSNVLKNINLLWIDDDIDNIANYINALKKEGANIFKAHNYSEVKKIIKDNKIDLFLIDIMMPPPNGIEILRRLYKRFPKANYAILSSFLYLQRYKEELASLKFEVQLLDVLIRWH